VSVVETENNITSSLVSYLKGPKPMSHSHFLFGWCLIIGLITRNTNASVGDRSPYYQTCVEKCSTANCTDG